MKIVNRSKKPTKEVDRLVRYAVTMVGARECVDLIAVVPMVDSHGWAEEGEEGHFCMVQLGSEQTFPYKYQYPGIKGAPKYVINSWKEHLVATVAHEATHCLEKSLGKRHSEIRAERTALAVLEAYRSGQD